jgi:hypothetical protein
MLSAVTSMAAMKHVQKRTQKQQSVGQELDDMSPMFRPKKIGRDR